MGPSARAKEFRWFEGLAILIGMIGIQCGSEVYAQWGAYVYSPPEGAGRVVFVVPLLAGIMFIVGRIFDAITDPILGSFSDRASTMPGRWRFPKLKGRRRPFMFWGGVLMLFTGMFFWWPPVQDKSIVNFVYGTFFICLHWFAFTAAMIALNALAPELARSKQARIRMGQWVSTGMIIGLAIAVIGPGEVAVAIDPPAEPGADPSSRGFMYAGSIFAVLTTLCFLVPVFVIRERFDSSTVEKRTPALREIFQAMTNRVFLFYGAAFFAFSIGILSAQRVLPHWIVVGLRQPEDAIVNLMGPYILAALFSTAVLCPWMGRRMAPKWMMFIAFGLVAISLPMMYPIAVSSMSATMKTVCGALLFATSGVSQGIIYVVIVALLGEIIDYDAQLHGERREAVFWAGNGIAWKLGQSMSIALAYGMLTLFGNSVDSPMGIYLVGPVAGLFGIIGMTVAWYYPKLDVTPETTEALLASDDQ